MHLIGNFIICWENAFSDNMEFHQNVGHFLNLNLGHLREKFKSCLTDFFCKGEGDKIRQKYFRHFFENQKRNFPPRNLFS